jgi:tetratricopeptide (TPR) repeat protein
MKAISPADRFKIAVRLEKDGHYEKAINEYLLIIHAVPKFRKAYINLGSLYSRMNRLKDAMKCYKAALSIGADYITYFNVGCIFYKTGKYIDALINLEKSIEINNKFALATLVAGLSHSRLNNLAEAENNFIEVLKTWPDNRVALTALAIIYYNENQFNKSLMMLNKILQRDADNIKIRELKSDILLKIGRIDESVSEVKVIKRKAASYKYFDEFIKAVPVETLTDKYGTIDDKIKSLNKKINKDASNLISLSLCYLLKGDTDTAIDYLFKYKKKPVN